jgi:hypothetical protein
LFGSFISVICIIQGEVLTNVEKEKMEKTNLVFQSLVISRGNGRGKNNKSASFDQINNEMIKAAFSSMAGLFLHLFNIILMKNVYPSPWKLDILSPLFKSGSKDDPNNFRGISVASCLGKVFNSLLRNRLENKVNKGKIMSTSQISGKSGARTSDHCLVFKHIVDKYVKKRQKQTICLFL